MKSNQRLGQSVAIASSAAAVLLLLSVIGCNTKQESEGVMAMVNGRKVLRTEVDKYYNNQTAEAPQKPTDEQADTLRLNILKELIDNEILMQRAEKLGLLATDDEVNTKLAEIKAPFSQQDFDKRLADRSITLADFKADLRRSITVEKVLNKEITSKINVTDEDITAYYNQHKAEFNLIEPQYHLAQILVTTQPNPQARNVANKAQNEAEAKKKIQMIENRLDSGEDFASVAMNFSRAAGNRAEWRRSRLRARVLAQGRQDQPLTRSTSSSQGSTSTVLVVGDPNSHQVFGYRVVRLHQQGIGRPTRVEGSARAAGDPRTASRPPRATAQSRVLRGHPRRGQGRKLLRRRHPEEGRHDEVAPQALAAVFFSACSRSAIRSSLFSRPMCNRTMRWP